MELEFEKTVCQSLHRAVWEVKNQEQTQEVRLSENMPDIGKILACWGVPVIRGKEWRNAGMNCAGGIMAWVLYQPEDGSSPQSVETWIPFQMKWDFPQTNREGTISLSALIRGMDARTISARKLMVRCGVAVLGEALEPVDIDVFSPGEIPGEVELLRRDYPVLLPREAGEKVFEISEALELPSDWAGEKPVSLQLEPEFEDHKVMAQRLVFRGNCSCKCLYLGNDGKLHSWEFMVPFSQFTELDREYDGDAKVRMIPMITALEAELEAGQLHIKCGLVSQYVICQRQMLPIAQDAYSNQCQVMPSFQELVVPAILEHRRENITAEAALDEKAGQIVDVAFWMDQPEMSREKDQVEAGMAGNFQTLFYDEEDRLQSGTARWNTTWQTEAGEGSCVKAWVSGRNLPRGTIQLGNPNLETTLALDSLTTAQQGIPMVTGLEIGPEKEKDPYRPALILRKLGNAPLWDLAKEYGSTVAAIENANDMEQARPGQFILIPVS